MGYSLWFYQWYSGGTSPSVQRILGSTQVVLSISGNTIMHRSDGSSQRFSRWKNLCIKYLRIITTSLRIKLECRAILRFRTCEGTKNILRVIPRVENRRFSPPRREKAVRVTSPPPTSAPRAPAEPFPLHASHLTRARRRRRAGHGAKQRPRG